MDIGQLFDTYTKDICHNAKLSTKASSLSGMVAL